MIFLKRCARYGLSCILTLMLTLVRHGILKRENVIGRTSLLQGRGDHGFHYVLGLVSFLSPWASLKVLLSVVIHFLLAMELISIYNQK